MSRTNDGSEADASSAPTKVRVGVIGAGMSGILAGIRLKEAGIDFTIFEKADRLGGTWRENTYPGIACDVPSHIYSYSFALNPEWSFTCSPGGEILEYFESVADRFGVVDSIRFNDAVTRCAWDGAGWQLETAGGHQDHFTFIIAATGILHHPKMPDIDGLDRFEGAMFHSAQWDHDVAIEGRRVGLIGTGSSGIQITGALAGVADKLSVFQRTAQWVVPIDQTAYTEEEKAEWRTDADLLTKLHEDMVAGFNDGFATSILDGESDLVASIEQRCRDHLDTAIADPELREKLRPDYKLGCKRLVVSHNFYDAIQHPQVELITDTVEAIEANGVRTADGAVHELDVLVLASGFKVDRFMRPMEVVGVEDVTLDEVWSQRPTAYLSLGVPGFPNFFMLNGPNSPVGNFSLIQTAELQFNYISQLIEMVHSGQATAMAPTEEAAARFDAERVEAAVNTVWATGCRSWYLDDRGIPFSWPFPFSRFRSEMDEPKLEDFTLS